MFDIVSMIKASSFARISAGSLLFGSGFTGKPYVSFTWLVKTFIIFTK